ncbi:SRPBCC domain-containing protein [Nonomuraea sp. NPDC049129]|uniref:SRPBCC domain-containing protein n=1 Tax=Nonomuraea sp. NPDC049129 TaxID=3155272 RepID=UPI0033DE085E
MPHEFEVRHDIELEASPEEVWQAIAEGPGIDSWFMGHSELEPREGGRGTQTFGGDFSMGSTVTVWEPGKRLAYRGDENPEDGTFMAFEYLIEGRESGSTVLRFVHSGFLGDDWESEYDALKIGDLQYLRKLAAYLKHFRGRISTHNLMLWGPQASRDQAWAAFQSVLGLTGGIAAGDRVTIAPDGVAPQEGVVEWVTDPGTFVGVRTDDGLYMLIHGQGTVVVEHHAYAEIDGQALEQSWQGWLQKAFA